ncbi:hypothetical protein HBH56_088580 [Parastagonospora nodorum]|uniref:Uncharacterized protein n=1 Tax=Phaeosphaeria nodorum (strain SN15 / ATCC MYA-4574 / FGSC 10173) TaxID=321614 RepID=A0A7U2F3J7_PHANO|nr:hypothetical protein HBH56_088580 [Parastagonospora nodorum]QRC98066.1 hypothetical protein JI435_041770 [Parastagonospora nodorum SN15]KAH3936698.1 hypothetical protein HBH54_023220 [Parastagonospora nodorum]KAH4110154.1 hypothetical protein HBH46_014230 [Parastagonospora nodorum]KAH4144998.1 hypothetical protein HBH45_013700 [Parastagonospora nodorum]
MATMRTQATKFGSSHSVYCVFGIKESTLKQEQEKFETLIEHYKMLYPLVGELVEKLEAGLEDEAAWCRIIDFNDRRLACGAELPCYTGDCEAVQLRLTLEQEKFLARFAEQDCRTGEEEAWVHVECTEDDGWAAQCGEGPQNGLSWGRTDDSDEGYETVDGVTSIFAALCPWKREFGSDMIPGTMTTPCPPMRT